MTKATRFKHLLLDQVSSYKAMREETELEEEAPGT